jgi:hypothetical protein
MLKWRGLDVIPSSSGAFLSHYREFTQTIKDHMTQSSSSGLNPVSGLEIEMGIGPWAYGKGWPWTPYSFTRARHALPFYTLPSTPYPTLQLSCTLLDTPRRTPMNWTNDLGIDCFFYMGAIAM